MSSTPKKTAWTADPTALELALLFLGLAVLLEVIGFWGAFGAALLTTVFAFRQARQTMLRESILDEVLHDFARRMDEICRDLYEDEEPAGEGEILPPAIGKD